MKKQSLFQLIMLLQLAFCIMAFSCKKTKAATIVGSTDAPTSTPTATPIPDNLAGTWWSADNQKPLTKNWEDGTFQGETGFKDFRTMVFTANGKDAIEYSSEVFEREGGTQMRYMYKVTGTLEYSATPLKLVFHAMSGRMRIFQSGSYTESAITAVDLTKYQSVLTDMAATATQLIAQRHDGGSSWTAHYLKVPGTGNGSSNGVPPGSPYLNIPATGTYVQIGQQYFPTVQIGNQEWMAVNYYGNDGITLMEKPKYGTFYRFLDLSKIPMPNGWRIPTRQDYLKLLQSQGIPYDPITFNTDGADVNSKRRLGQLMSVTGWLKQDGYANNLSGFNAIPANTQLSSSYPPYGEGSNCLLWTSERDVNDYYIAFKILQLPSDTYAGFSPYPETYNPVHMPVRLVRDK